MRLRLFERLGRLVSWRPGWQGPGSGRPADSTGRRRRTPAAGTAETPAGGTGPAARPPGGAAQRPSASRAAAGRPCSRPRPVSRRRSPQSGPAPRTSNWMAGGPARPPLPRNYSPAAGGVATGGGGVGRARIREAPQFGAAPVETAARGQDGASQPPAATPRQPWYQVVGEPAGPRERACRPTRQGPSTAPPPRRGRRRRRCSARRARAPGWRATRPRRRCRSPPRIRAATGPPSTVVGTAVRLRPSCGGSGTLPRPPRPRKAIAAIERLAEFPRALQEKLAAGLDGIYVGAGRSARPRRHGRTARCPGRRRARQRGTPAPALRRPEDRGRHPAVADPGRVMQMRCWPCAR